MRVLLAGGGSGGSATPVLAVASELRARVPDIELLYIATEDGPEAALVADERLPYVGIKTGKLRRYLDWQNLTDLGRVAQGVAQSIGHVRRFRPDAAFGAGGFASVPPLAAAGLLRVPVLIHQQDAMPGLANRLLVPFAQRITVALPDTVTAFPARKTAFRGNPVRPRILAGDAVEGFRRFGLDPAAPLLLVTGGGTGALGLNRIVAAAAPNLIEFCQIIHLTGRGRGVPTAALGPHYQQHELIVGEMPHVLAAAAIVLTRAGMGTLTELSALSKPTIIVPMPGSHQEANAHIYNRHGAAVVFEQAELTPDRLVQAVRGLLEDDAQRATLGQAIHALTPTDAASRIAEDVLALARRF